MTIYIDQIYYDLSLYYSEYIYYIRIIIPYYLLSGVMELRFSQKHCKSFLQSSAQNFEPYKPDNAILWYQNQHARQLGLDFLSFTN